MSTESRGEFSDLHSIFRLRALRYETDDEIYVPDCMLKVSEL